MILREKIQNNLKIILKKNIMRFNNKKYTSAVLLKYFKNGCIQFIFEYFDSFNFCKFSWNSNSPILTKFKKHKK